MVKSSLKTMSVQDLVARFEQIALEQHDAILNFQNVRYNRLYKEMLGIRSELKSRVGDRRRALVPLLESGNLQVKLMTANTLLAIVPEQARKALEGVRDDGQLPQAADAALMLAAIDDGSFVPH